MGCRSPLRPLIAVCVVVSWAHPSPASAGPYWTHRETRGLFKVHANLSIEQVAGVLDELDALTADVQATLELRMPGVDRERHPIDVYLFSSRGEYRRRLAGTHPEADRRAALFVKEGDSSSVYVYHDRDLPKNLRHEATHALLHRALPLVPLWLDEGLAVYFEPPAELRAAPQQLARVRWGLRTGWRPSLSELDAKPDLAAMSAGDYRHAWAWVHFLLHESDESSSVLVDYLQKTQAGDPPGSPGEWIRRRIPDAEGRAAAHLRRWVD